MQNNAISINHWWFKDAFKSMIKQIFRLQKKSHECTDNDITWALVFRCVCIIYTIHVYYDISANTVEIIKVRYTPVIFIVNQCILG